MNSEYQKNENEILLVISMRLLLKLRMKYTQK